MTNEEIVKSIQDGNRELFPQLWEQVKKYAIMRADKYLETHTEHDHAISVEDLYQEAYFAMIEALDSFDISLGYSFLNYYDYHLLKHFVSAAGYRTKSQRVLIKAESIYKSIAGEDDECQLIDTLKDKKDYIEEAEEKIYKEQLKNEVEKLVNGTLKPEEKEIISNYYYENKTLSQIAEERKVSKERVRIIKLRALKTMKRKAMTSKYKNILEYTYHHVGVDEFNRTHTSEVERAVLMSLGYEHLSAYNSESER